MNEISKEKREGRKKIPSKHTLTLAKWAPAFLVDTSEKRKTSELQKLIGYWDYSQDWSQTRKDSSLKDLKCTFNNLTVVDKWNIIFLILILILNEQVRIFIFPSLRGNENWQQEEPLVDLWLQYTSPFLKLLAAIIKGVLNCEEADFLSPPKTTEEKASRKFFSQIFNTKKTTQNV